MKADHQSKQYRLEDQLLKYFPEEIEKHKGFIKGFELTWRFWQLTHTRRRLCRYGDPGRPADR